MSLAATGLLIAGCSSDAEELPARSSTQGAADRSAGSDSQGVGSDDLAECRISPSELSLRTRTADAVHLAATLTDFVPGQDVELEPWRSTTVGDLDESAFYAGFQRLCGSEYWKRVDPEAVFCAPQNMVDCDELRGTYTVVDGQQVVFNDLISDKVAVLPKFMGLTFCSSWLQDSYSHEQIVDEAAWGIRTAGVSVDAAREALSAFMSEACP
ncbi:hypothetical protein [Rhodococcoides kroppenstedtii]|uniref:hypothetical protein n=1 Tax=Rhodococcoides kroppenstedtii TaxID=293050 RepID=UPI0036267CA6